MMEKRTEYLILGIIYALVFLTWGWNSVGDLPFGDVDSSTHFLLSDYQTQQNTITKYALPRFINATYGFANNGNIWYPPQFHLLGAIFQKLNVDRVSPLFLFYLMGSTLFILTFAILLRELFGFYPALLFAILSMFSLRDHALFLSGLWPERLSFAITPLVLLYFYRGNFYIGAILLAAQFAFHPQGAIHSIIMSVIYVLFLSIKYKKIALELKPTIMATIIFLILISPFIFVFTGFGKNVMQEEYGSRLRISELSSLLKWYPEKIPYTPAMGNYFYVYRTYLLLPVFFVGLFFILMKRQREHILALSMLLGIYIAMHLNVIGIYGRVHRALNAEQHVFYLFVALGLFSICSLGSNIFNKKIITATIVIIAAMYPAYMFMITTPELSLIPTMSRVTKQEYDGALFLQSNVPSDSKVLNVGTVIYSKNKWLQAISERQFIYDDTTLFGKNSPHFGKEDYYYVDEYDSLLFGLEPAHELVVKLEAIIRENATLIYGEKNGIRIYKR